MKIKVKESTVVKHIMKALDINYPGFYFKVHGGLYQATGLPDIIGLHRGRFIGIEVKVPGKENTLTKKQAQTIRKINLAGGISFMAISPQQVLVQLKEEFVDDNSKRKSVKASATSGRIK